MKVIVYGDIGGSGGYVNYCRGILSTKSIPEDIDLTLISSNSLLDSIAPLNERVNIITHPWIDSHVRIKRYLWYLIVYPRIVNKIKPDIEFFTLGQLRVYLRKAKTITVCHNLLFFDDLELHGMEEEPFFWGLIRMKNVLIKSFKKSFGVIYLSNFSRKVVDPIIKNGNNIVISHGFDQKYLRVVERSYAINTCVKMLYVSPFYTYKHQLEVIEAVALLKKETNKNIKLKLIGGGGTNYQYKLIEKIQINKLEENIILIDFLDAEAIKVEYENSDIAIFASSCETFGITLLEAMGERLPIACSDRTGLPEILKDAGEYFNPTSPDSICRAMIKLIEEESYRKHLGEKAYQYACEYSWDDCAIKTYNYLKEVNSYEA